MAQFYNEGERKVRPGTYFRYENAGSNVVAGASGHAVAIPIQADWGPVDKVTVHESITSLIATYGSSKTVDAAVALFEGGAPKVYCIRLNKASTDTSGTAAAAASLAIADESSPAVTITAKHPGTKAIKVQTRIKIEGVSKEILVYDGNTKVESFSFAIGTDENEVENLVKAVSASAYITATAGTGTTVPVKDITALTGGADPTVSTESYSEALNKLETYSFTHIALDCTTAAVQAILQTWVDRVFEGGKYVQAIIGGDNQNTEFSELTKAAKACDNMKVIYSGIWGRNAEDAVVDGYKMAAYVAGAIAGTPSNQSIVHLTVPGIVSIEPYTNPEYEQAIASGLLLASYSSNGTVWFDSAINTLTNLSAEQDEGWKKIRRVTTRFELMNRIDEADANLVGKINCDNDGISQVIQTRQGVLNAMISEGKLQNGATVYEDPENLRNGDSAWFIIEALDLDSLEKIYTKYGFRFSSNS